MKNTSELNALKILNDSSFRKMNFSSSRGTYPVFVFLCGKQKKEGDNRDFLTRNIIVKKPFRFSVYSEDLFPLVDDIGIDLLSFEEKHRITIPFIKKIIEKL